MPKPEISPNRLAVARSGSGPAVLFLHPIGLHGGFWQPVIDALEGRLTSHAVDLPGHGGSKTGQGAPTIPGMAADLAAWMRAEGLESAIVVGCSLGGMVAQALAAQDPDLVRGLVLANTNFTQTEAGRAAMRDRAALARKGMDQVTDPWLERWFSPETRAGMPDAVALIAAMLLAADAETHARCWEAIGDLDLADALPRITAPALVVAGGDDRSIPLEKSRDLAAALPQAELRLFEGAGHLTPYERPQEFADLVLDFAQSLRAG